MSAFSRLSAASRPRQRKVCGSSPACVRTSQPYHLVRRGHRLAASCSQPSTELRMLRPLEIVCSRVPLEATSVELTAPGWPSPTLEPPTQPLNTDSACFGA